MWNLYLKHTPYLYERDFMASFALVTYNLSSRKGKFHINNSVSTTKFSLVVNLFVILSMAYLLGIPKIRSFFCNTKGK